MLNKITQMIRDLRKKGYNIKYIFIPELHADGINWHLHGLISRYNRQTIPESKWLFKLERLRQVWIQQYVQNSRL